MATQQGAPRRTRKVHDAKAVQTLLNNASAVADPTKEKPIEKPRVAKGTRQNTKSLQQKEADRKAKFLTYFNNLVNAYNIDPSDMDKWYAAYKLLSSATQIDDSISKESPEFINTRNNKISQLFVTKNGPEVRVIKLTSRQEMAKLYPDSHFAYSNWAASKEIREAREKTKSGIAGERKTGWKYLLDAIKTSELWQKQLSAQDPYFINAKRTMEMALKVLESKKIGLNPEQAKKVEEERTAKRQENINRSLAAFSDLRSIFLVSMDPYRPILEYLSKPSVRRSPYPRVDPRDLQYGIPPDVVLEFFGRRMDAYYKTIQGLAQSRISSTSSSSAMQGVSTTFNVSTPPVQTSTQTAGKKRRINP